MTHRSLFFLNLFLGVVTGLSSIPVKGFQGFALIGFSSFFYVLKDDLLLKKIPLWIGCFTFGYFLIALHWIVFSLHVNWGLYFYLIPFAIFALPFLFSLYHVFGFWVFPCAQTIRNPFVFSFLWTSLEIIRAEFLTGFPWASLGYMWTTILPVAQMASLIGPYGLSFFTIIWFALPYFLLSKGHTSFQKILYGLFVLVTMGGMWIYGATRLQSVVDYSKTHIRLVQPNSPQEFRWTNEKMESQLEELVHLSTSPSKQPLQAVIWPEFSLPLAPQVYPWMAGFIKQSIPDGGIFITNGFFYEQGLKGYHVYNAILAFGEGPQFINFYGKHRLLPFGEYIPFRSVIDAILPGQIHKMSGGMGDFMPGDGPKILKLPHLPPLLPMVCHEAIFSGAFQGEDLVEVQWILALTNDGWFLKSLGPYQHLEMARMRAIEMGLPLVRVANTGITALIDPMGRTCGEIPYGIQSILDVTLPHPLKDRPFYAQKIHRDFYPNLAHFLELMLFFAFIVTLYRGRKK